jgi:transposase
VGASTPSTKPVSAVQLLAKIEARNPDKRIIHVIWDNAAYHKGPDVRAFLARPECRVHLIQLPPYCPHLNPASQRMHAFACRPTIERSWGVMHQRVTHNRHYSTQKQLANAILRFFRETIRNEWKTFGSQVSDNFRAITHQKVRVLE